MKTFSKKELKKEEIENQQEGAKQVRSGIKLFLVGLSITAVSAFKLLTKNK